MSVFGSKISIIIITFQTGYHSHVNKHIIADFSLLVAQHVWIKTWEIVVYAGRDKISLFSSGQGCGSGSGFGQFSF